MSMLKYVLALFVLIVVSHASVCADEGYIPFFPDFLEPDGIKVKWSQEYYETYIYYGDAGGYTEIIRTDNELSHLGPISSFPISITLPETLKTSWSFRAERHRPRPLIHKVVSRICTYMPPLILHNQTHSK